MAPSRHAEDHQAGERRSEPSFLLRILASSRYFVAIAGLGSFLAAVTLLVYGALDVGRIVWDTVAAGDLSADGAKHLSVEFVELVDAFLLGTVLYIIALGLYELFIRPDLPVPDWLRVRDLNDLKGNLIGVINVLLGVSFLGSVVEWTRGGDILYLGAAVALVFAAFSLLLWVGHRPHNDGGHPHSEQ